MYRTLKSPISVQAEVTWLCDNSCIHCYNFWAEERTRNNLPTLTKDQMLYIIDQVVENEIFDLTFTGGEPLLFPEVLLAGMLSAVKNGLKVGLNSNLTHLTPEIAKELKFLGLRGVLTSLAGPTPEIHDAVVDHKGAFEKTLRGIKIAHAAGIHTSVNMVVTTINQNYVLETGRLAAKLGAKCFGATRTTAPGNCPQFNSRFRVSREAIKEHLNLLLQIKKECGIQVDVFEHYPHCLLGDLERFSKMSKRRCTAGVNTMAIGADGSLRPCTHNEKSYGNIFEEDGLRKAWSQMGEWRDGSLISDECRQCPYLISCSGGCRMDAKAEGNIRGMDSYATSPADVQKANRTKKKRLALPSKLKVIDSLRMRTESFGGAVKSPLGGLALLDEEGFIIIKELIQEGAFTLNEVAQRYNISLREAESFLGQLFAKKILIKV